MMTSTEPPRAFPRLAVIVVNWNQWALLRACLTTLENCTWSALEIYVVDNGSTDGSAGLCARHFPAVRLIRLPENRGFAGGNNVALREVLEQDFPYVLLLNNDTEVEPGFLEPLVAALEADPWIGATGSKILYADQPGLIWSAGGRIELTRGRIWHRGLREPDDGRLDAPADVDYLTGCALMLRGAALRQVGLLDEGTAAYGEDTDLCRRVREAGWRLVYVPGSVVRHKISASSGGARTWRKALRRARGQLWFFRRHAPWWAWPGILWGLAAEAWRVVRGRE
jgi:GT2 family glycosyltransferase